MGRRVIKMYHTLGLASVVYKFTLCKSVINICLFGATQTYSLSAAE